MRFILFVVLTFTSFSISAGEEVSLKNDREGKSFYDSRKIRWAQSRALKRIDSKDIIYSFNSIVSQMPEEKLCSFEINKHLKVLLKNINPKFKQLPGALYHLRSKDEIDDVTLKILLNADKVETTNLWLPKKEEDLWLPRDNAKLAEMLELIGGMNKKIQDSCLDEAYRGLYSDLVKVDKGIKRYHFEALYVEAYKLKMIDFKTYKALESARVNGLEKTALDLKSYYKKMKSLRAHFPLPDSNEKSDFATAKFNKHGSRRQRLLEQYSDLQIMLMGDVIKKLRSRLESSKIEILVYAREEVDETITLEPMERFRFAIKILRKEMAHLSLNTYFNGNAPDYTDLMAAAYETGIIPALEMEEIAGLKDIWSPQKTFWEKARYWVQTFGSVATLVMPPPYGFLPALALVVIEATAGKNQSTNENTSLF